MVQMPPPAGSPGLLGAAGGPDGLDGGVSPAAGAGRPGAGVDAASVQSGAGGRHHAAADSGGAGQPQLRRGTQRIHLEAAGDDGDPGAAVCRQAGVGNGGAGGASPGAQRLFHRPGPASGPSRRGSMGALGVVHPHQPGGFPGPVHPPAGVVPSVCQPGGGAGGGAVRQLFGAAVPALPRGDPALFPLGVLWPSTAGADALGGGHPDHHLLLEDAGAPGCFPAGGVVGGLWSDRVRALCPKGGMCR